MGGQLKHYIFIGLILLGQNSMAVDDDCGGYKMVNSTSTSLVVPPVPIYQNCETSTTDSEGNVVITMDQACLASNQEKERTYSFQNGCYQQASQAQQQAQQAAQTAEQQRLAQQEKLNSAKAAAESAQNKNKEGSQIYQAASAGLSAVSQAFFAAAAGCGTAPGCPPPLIMKGIAFAALSMLASKQASSHDQVANNACVAASQVSSEAGSCGGAPAPYNPQSYPQTYGANIGSVFDQNGKCIGKPSDCQTIISNLPPGTNIKDALKGLDSFASGGSKIFKVDKDGNIITKDGKKYSAADFASEQAMMAAGLSAAEAKSLMADLNRAGAGFNAKAALAKENAKDASGAFGDVGGAGGLKGNSSALNGAADLDKNIGGGKRDPASAEGLAKEFNGDMIGVAGDDIFKMMNRRYKLKANQDNFIAP